MFVAGFMRLVKGVFFTQVSDLAGSLCLWGVCMCVCGGPIRKAKCRRLFCLLQASFPRNQNTQKDFRRVSDFSPESPRPPVLRPRRFVSFARNRYHWGDFTFFLYLGVGERGTARRGRCRTKATT
ncbi:hypothetical protein BDP55DRAFT_206800 [Colletotrichum godetiae]|uniref:Uncharacterized protein n=1 Tax=Colletotrichum godetiae TaxID=1209918 RepID=A0AAJ0AWW7_9PEZI|nr:uncharacterized protein BDP55DRAFT_206800 [Colletotrichum godetiae]KAK1699767.1 hypothetical protein BDP55DRAFT_206800 [Colletotrichum godetiae]